MALLKMFALWGALVCLAACTATPVGSGPLDAGTAGDGGMSLADGGTSADGGSPVDGGTLTDGGSSSDGGLMADGGGPGDGGPGDGGLPLDGGPACTIDDTCQDDSYCEGGSCVPYGTGPRGETNPACTRIVPAGLLAPQIACEWLEPAMGDPFPLHKQVLTTPLVMDFNFDNHRGAGVDNPTVKPSIVVVTYDALDGRCGLGVDQAGPEAGVIRILDGRTCEQQYVIPANPTDPRVDGSATPALGDLDGDGRAEIVTLSATGGLIAFRFDDQASPPAWTILWTSHRADGSAHDPLAGLCMWTGVTLADLDDDGLPEVIAEGYVYDATGKLLDESAALLNAAGSHGSGQFPVIADVDRDGVPELVSARRLMRWNSASSKWDLVQTYPNNAGYVAVADFGTVSGTSLDRSRLDGIAEIAVILLGTAWIMALDGTIVFGPVTLPGSAGGGPPTIGDFDNDGRPELAAAGSDSYTVFDPDCAAGATAEFCASGRTDGILWTSVSQDHSSNRTGSSVFDFEGNGTAEAVYADECYARIYDGKTGEVLFSQPHSSCTWNEYPVVADVAGSFRSRLIVPSNENCTVTCPSVDPNFKGLRCMEASDCPSGLPCQSGFCRCTTDAECNTATVGGGFQCLAPPAGVPGTGNTCRAAFTTKRSGVRVFGDVLDRWAGSRPVWNQHAYSVTNVGDFGSIPRTSQAQRNWDQPGLNNFRMNVQGTAGPQDAPDVTSRGSVLEGACGAVGITLSATICNRGRSPVGDGLPIVFRESAQTLCTAGTPVALSPGACTAVSCNWVGGQAGTHDVVVTADDDGTGAGTGQATECTEGNNRASLQVTCRPL